MIQRGLFNHILCTHHQLPITRIQISQNINAEKRLMCSKCLGAGESIEHLLMILDQLKPVFQPNQQIFMNIQLKLQNLKLEVGNIINSLFQFMERVIQESEFEITKIMRYIKYQEFYQEFKLEDLQKMVEFVFTNDIQKSLIYKISEQLKEIQQKYQYQFTNLFDQLKDLIKSQMPQILVKGNSSDDKQYPDSSEKKINSKPQIPLPKKKAFVKKREYETSLINAALINSTGDLLILGQYSFKQFKNLEINSINDNLEFKPHSIVDINDDSTQNQVTALAFNEKFNQLFVGYEDGLISTYQNSQNVWNRTDSQKLHINKVQSLIIDFSNTELFSAGKDNIIKSYSCLQGLKVFNKIKSFEKEINDIQFNHNSQYIFVILENYLNILNNNNELSEFQQILLTNEEKITCQTQINNQIYVGSDLGNIYIYEQQESRGKFILISSKILQSQSIIQIRYCETAKLLLTLFECEALIYQIDSCNNVERLQEIKGNFEFSLIHQNEKYCKMILFSKNDFKSIIYQKIN